MTRRKGRVLADTAYIKGLYHPGGFGYLGEECLRAKSQVKQGALMICRSMGFCSDSAAWDCKIWEVIMLRRLSRAAGSSSRHDGRLHKLVRRTPRPERPILIALILVVGSLWGFIELAEAVVEGEAHTIDTKLLMALRSPGDPSDPLGPRWLEETMRDITGLGGIGVLALLTAGAAGFLTLIGKRGAALTVLVAVGTGLLLSSLLKTGFDRPRPDLVPHGTTVYTASFPSGHSMLAAITYLTLGALLTRFRPSFQVRLFTLGMAVLLTLLIGISRVYLGVHWPTDVLAGWTIGACWALLCWTVARTLQRRGQIEGERDPGPGTDKDRAR